MEHVTFARFPDRQRALAAVKAMQRQGTVAPVLAHWGATDPAAFEQVVQHSGDFAETDLRHALVVGGLAGSTTGALFGALLAWFGVFPGTLGQGLLFGALMGVLVGLLMMSIIGSGLMDRRLQRLTKGRHAGEVVLTVRSADRATTDNVQQLLRDNGAVVAEKGAV